MQFATTNRFWKSVALESSNLAISVFFWGVVINAQHLLVIFITGAHFAVLADGSFFYGEHNGLRFQRKVVRYSFVFPKVFL